MKPFFSTEGKTDPPLTTSPKKESYLDPNCTKVSADYITYRAIVRGLDVGAELKWMNMQRQEKGLPPLENTVEELNQYE